MKNQISKLYNAVSAPVAASRDALSERLESVLEVGTVLYDNFDRENKIKIKKCLTISGIMMNI